MSVIKVYSADGVAKSDLTIDDALLETNRGGQAVHESVVAFRAAQRAGTASTLRKGEVAGSNKKPWRQKGTGRARAGYRQSPVWRGGGVAFGPHPRSYAKKVNRKMGQLAFRRAFSDRIADGGVRVVENLEAAEPRTKTFAALLKGLKISGPVLVVLNTLEGNAYRAARNIARAEVVSASMVNVYQVVRYPAIVVAGDAMETIKARLAGSRKKAS
jgi:large subunit ribosomal protein L4